MYDHSPRVSPPDEVACGDIEAGFAKADIIIQNDYTVPVREHAAMEPESALVYMDGEQLVCVTGLYHAFVQGNGINRQQFGDEAGRRAHHLSRHGRQLWYPRRYADRGDLRI